MKRSKLFFIFAAVVLSCLSFSPAQPPRTGLNDFNIGGQYVSAENTSGHNSYEGGVQGGISGSVLNSVLSLLGIWDERNEYSLRVGDFAGANIAADGSPYLINFGYVLGGQAIFAVNDAWDIGAKYYLDARKYYNGADGSPVRNYTLTPALMLRFQSLYLDGAYGTGSKNSTDYKSLVVNARYFMDNDFYWGFRFDQTKTEYPGADYKYLGMGLQFGTTF